MNVIRTAGPDPIVTPAGVPGNHSASDAGIAALIAAVQAGIDGPTGWLGRSLGKQELELTLERFSRIVRLPYEPVREIVSITYLDEEGEEQSVDEAAYRLAAGNRCQFGTGFAFPRTACAPDAVTIRYKSGYEPGQVPASAKQAVIIGVQQIKAMSEQSLFLREEQVEGVGQTVYTVSDATMTAVKAATDMLLQPLRVYWL